MGRFLHLHDRVLPPFFPRVVVEAAVDAGVPREAIFAGTGLAPGALESPEARISYAQLSALIDNAQRLSGAPALALDAGSRARLTSLGLLGAAVMSSENAGQALATLLRHWSGLSPGLALQVRYEGEQIHLVIEPTLELPCLEFLMDMSLVALAEQAEAILGRPAPVLEAHTINPPAPHRFRRFVEQAGLRTTFGAPQTEVVLDAQMLSWPCVHAEPNTRALAERMHIEAMQSTRPAGMDVVQQVERALDAVDERNPSVSDVAKELGTSARTLRRLLANSGTSFRALRDASLERRAVLLLQQEGMTQVQISERLGYADVRAFRRAFKRWTGRTPSMHPSRKGPLRSGMPEEPEGDDRPELAASGES